MMSIMVGEWSLSEIARLLAQPQHRLIYLCEKGAIVPDLGKAHGRGSSRRFSARNVLEFAVALRLRSLALPVDTVGAILYALRSFETSVRREVPGFDLVQDLRRRGAPQLRVLVGEGPRVYFSLTGGGGPPRLFGGIDLPARRGTRPRTIPEIESTAEALNGSAKLEVNVTDVAKGLDLKA
jgi:hypothetical protein